jgi:hypothetical protein
MASASLEGLSPFPRTGISPLGLRSFITSCGGEDALRGLSTESVCARFMLPRCEGGSRSYCEVLGVGAGGAAGAAAGPATVFVSHAWGYAFLDVCSALLAWADRRAAAGPPFFWFDIFSNRQREGVARPFEWWRAVFFSSVKSLGHTLLVLSWADPKPLVRAWCLVEIAASLDDGCQLEVVMPPDDEGAFLGALQERFQDVVKKLCTVDVARASAYHGAECLVPAAPAGGGGGGGCGGVEAAAAAAAAARVLCRDVVAGALAECPQDLHRIREATEAHLGFSEVNKRVTARMRAWMLARGAAALAALPPATRDGSRLALGYGRLLTDVGALGEAEALLRRHRGAAGGAGRPALDAAAALGAVLKQAGSPAPGRAPRAPLLLEAEEVFRDALARAEALLGAGHADTLRLVVQLALTVKDVGRGGALEEAEALLRRVLVAQRGGGDRGALITASALAGVLARRGEAAEARELLEDTLAKQCALLGVGHPNVVITASQLAGVLADGDCAEGRARAEALWREAISAQQKSMEEHHPNALRTVELLAGFLRREGRPGDAAALLGGAAAALRRAGPARRGEAEEWAARAVAAAMEEEARKE